MLSAEFQDRVSRAIQAGMAPRNRELPLAIGALDAKAAMSGSFHSGGRLWDNQQAIAQDLRTRGVIIWAALVRAHRALGAPNDGALRQDLKEAFGLAFDLEADALTNMLNEILAKSAIKAGLSLADVAAETRHKHELEVDLYVDSLAPAAAPAHLPVYNFYGAVGAVQTGAASVAHVVQNLNAGDKASLVAALDEVKTAFATAPAPPPNRDELIEIADECVAEVQSASPNNSRLRGMFDVLSSSVQAIASAPGAYQALKVALVPLGILLP